MANQRRPTNEFMDLPIVQAHMRSAAEFVARNAATRFIETTDGVLRHSRLVTYDSPLEVMFHIWWSAAEREWVETYPYECLELQPQVEIDVNGEHFRLDFVVKLHETRWQKAIDAGLMVWPKIGVEVDGHAFHERTPEQVAHRDRRDRLLQQAGWKVFHYSYNEFTKQPQQCVEEVYDLATTTVVDLYRQYSLDIPPEFHAET